MNKVWSFLTSNRVKSLAWRTAMMMIATGLSAVANNVGVLALSPETTIFIGLVLGEISKAINSSFK